MILNGFGAHALIEKENKFLVVKRSDYKQVFPGLWDLPGGSSEINEQPHETVVREVLEETGLQIGVESLVNTYCSDYNDHWVMVCIYKAVILNGVVSLSNEHTEYKWVSWNEMKDLNSRDTIFSFFKTPYSLFSNM